VECRVVDDEGGKTVEFRDGGEEEFVYLQVQLDPVLADTMAQSGGSLRCKLRVVPVSGDTRFAFSLSIPGLGGVNLSFYNFAERSPASLSMGAFDSELGRNLDASVPDGMDRYLDFEAKVVPDAAGGGGARVSISIDGSELFSVKAAAVESARNGFFAIACGNKNIASGQAAFLIQSLELKPL